MGGSGVNMACCDVAWSDERSLQLVIVACIITAAPGGVAARILLQRLAACFVRNCTPVWGGGLRRDRLF